MHSFVIPYRHSPVLYNVQIVHLYNIEIAQYSDEPSHIQRILVFDKNKFCIRDIMKIKTQSMFPLTNENQI